jgi:imidazolonepropionase-like amidohydrolase
MRAVVQNKFLFVVCLSFSIGAMAQNPYVSVNAPVFVLDHVRVIDGTGVPEKEDQAVVVAQGKIQSIGPAGANSIPQGAQRMELSGYTVIPGLVGMHNHLYYTDSAAVQFAGGKLGEPGLFIAEIPYTAPMLYLAAGVTTMRTTGSVEPYTDMKVKSRIDSGHMPGPSIDASAPYLEGAPTIFAQMHEHHPGRAGDGYPRSAREGDETHRASLFRDLARGHCARHR